MVSSPTTPATTNRPTASPNQWLVANKPVAMPHLKIPRPVAMPRPKRPAEIPRPVAVPRLKWSAEIPRPVAVPRLKVPKPVLCPTEANLNPQLTRWNQRMQRQQQDRYLQEVSWLGSAWELMQQQKHQRHKLRSEETRMLSTGVVLANDTVHRWQKGLGPSLDH